MTYYNLTNLSTSIELYDQVRIVNEASEGMLVFGFLLALFLILFIATKVRYDFKASFATSSFITTIVSVLFLVAGLTNAYIVIVLVVMSAGGAVMLISEGG